MCPNESPSKTFEARGATDEGWFQSTDTYTNEGDTVRHNHDSTSGLPNPGGPMLRITARTELRTWVDEHLGPDAEPQDIDNVTRYLESLDHRPAWGADFAEFLDAIPDLWDIACQMDDAPHRPIGRSRQTEGCSGGASETDPNERTHR